MPKKRKISTSVIVARINADDGVEVLLQFKRKYTNWEFPGGKLDGNETTEECAWRELIEETDINAQTLYYRTHVEGRTFLDMVLWASKWNRTPKLMEPDKHSALAWFPIDDLPEPLGWYTATAVKQGALNGLADMVRCEANPPEFRIRTPRRDAGPDGIIQVDAAKGCDMLLFDAPTSTPYCAAKGRPETPRSTCPKCPHSGGTDVMCG